MIIIADKEGREFIEQLTDATLKAVGIQALTSVFKGFQNIRDYDKYMEEMNPPSQNMATPEETPPVRRRRTRAEIESAKEPTIEPTLEEAYND